MTAVVDSTVLIALARLRLLHLLPRLFGEVVVPQAVIEETVERRPDAAGASEIRNALTAGLLVAWRDVGAAGPARESGAGERAAIGLAQEIGAEFLLLDDLPARTRARRETAARITGVVGILRDARDSGLIDAAVPLLEQLRAEGFRIGEDLMNDVRLEEQE